MKLIATLGPATSKEDRIKKILEHVEGIRLNLKHGTFEEHRRRIEIVRKLEKELGKHIAIIGDIPGVEIRTGDFPPKEIKKGDIITIYFEKKENAIYIDNKKIVKFLKEDISVLIDDGKVKLRIIEVCEDCIKAKVIYGDRIEPRKSVSFLGTELKLSIFENPKNLELLEFIVENDIDIVAVSFVQNKENIEEVRRVIRKLNGDQFVMAKIEYGAALKNLKSIVKNSDLVMVARGDLAVEVGLEKLPVVQKKIVDIAIKYIKPVYIATEFLPSLLTKKQPTRAEVSDIANAIIDGADGIILTNETAIGKYPVRAVKIARNVIKNALKLVKRSEQHVISNVNTLVAKHACMISESLENSIIVAETESGFTAVNVSRFKPRRDIYVVTNNRRVARLCSILWGVKKVKINKEIINKIPTPSKLKEIFNESYSYIVYVGSPILEKKTTMINVFQF